MTQNPDEWIGLSEDIMDYLSAHPLASDTAEGISLWWLKRQRYEASAKQVGLALEELERRGSLEKILLADGRILYALSPAQNPFSFFNAEKFLDTGSHPAGNNVQVEGGSNE